MIFFSFDWTDEWSTTGCEGQPISFKREMNESYHIAQAIGTLVRITLKKKGLNYLEENDMNKAEKITKEILEIMKIEQVNKTTTTDTNSANIVREE